jgi:hypothetical protein
MVMKNLLTTIAGTAFLLLDIGGTVQAAMLSSSTIEFSGGFEGRNFFSNQFELFTSIQPQEISDDSLFRPFSPTLENPALFRGESVTSLDVGKTFTVTEATDVGFSEYVTLLTNGKKNNIGFFLINSRNNFVSARGGDESKLTEDTKKIDFTGNIIDSISVTLDSLSFAPEGLTGVQVNAQTTWKVFGQPLGSLPAVELPSTGDVGDTDLATSVPEPSPALALLTLGLINAGVSLRRKRRPNNVWK